MIDLKILAIDTSGKIASVAITEGEKLLGEITYLTKLTHSQVILPLVNDLLEKVELALCDIDCIAVSEGPGSYTGLRIGISAVKGLCFDGKTRCVGISTLKALAQNVSCFEGTVVSVMNARPEVAYFGGYFCKGGELKEVLSDRVGSYDEIFKYVKEIDGRVMLVGDICEKLKGELFADFGNVLVAPEALRVQRASSLCQLAQKDTSLWEGADKLDARYLQVTKAEKDLGK